MKVFRNGIIKIRLAIMYMLVGIPLVHAQEEKIPEVAKEIIPEGLLNVGKEQLDTARNLIDMIIEFFVKYSFQAIGGIIVLILGIIVARLLARWVDKLLGTKSIDVTVTKFIVGTVKLLVITFAIIVALGKFGIEIAPLIAGISVAGFGLSFALQGPLSNYAAGAVLIFTKPFKVGEVIEVAGINGEVTDMKLPRTEMRAVDGNLIVVPNKHIIGEIIHNYSTSKKLDLNIGVAYKADVDKAISIINTILADDKRVNKSSVGISEFADSSVNIYARVWCQQKEYWNVMFDSNKKIFDSFNKEGIEIPFPQRDVHLFQEKS